MHNMYEDENSEKILFEGKPNIFFYCKSVFLWVMLLGVISYISPGVLSLVYELQIYLINFVYLPLVTYISYFFIIVSFLIILRVIWILLVWKATYYIVTNFRLVLIEGIVVKNSYYMPFGRIQDILVSQGIIHRIFSVGDVIIVSAYDSTEIKFNNIHNPYEFQEMIINEVNKDYVNSSRNVRGFHSMPSDTFDDYNDIHDLIKDDPHQQETTNDHYSYHNKKSYFNEKQEYKENNRKIKKKNDKNTSIIDDYSKKFKKPRK